MVVAFMTYSAQLQSPIMQLGQIYNALLQAAAGANRVFAILDEDPSVQDKPDAKAINMAGGHVVFKHVDFSYVKGRKICATTPSRRCRGTRAVRPHRRGQETIINILTRGLRHRLRRDQD